MGKKQHEEHDNHERWIIPYADMVTLLFAFFVVLYTMSRTDMRKQKKVSESLTNAFVGDKKGGDRTKQLDIVGIRGQPITSRRFVTKRDITNDEIIDQIKESLDREGFDVIYQDHAVPIQYKIDERGVVISISTGYLFEKNSIEIPTELYPVLQIIANIIKKSKRLVRVEGSTDDQPVVGNKFFDNWDLSVLRATSMVKVLIQEFGVDPKLLTASGYAQYKPIASNKSQEGRRQNRRVDIVMLDASKPSDLLQGQEIPGAAPQPTADTSK